MDALKPWLAATIEGELGEALRHREDGTNRHQSIGKPQEPSYDDGSNLRIPSAKKGPVVQITKFLTFKEPLQVTLSDSVTRVNASITNQASQHYAKKNRRRLTENTVGGLIQLLEFEIVATHLGPRDKRLTLYVKDFVSLGSNGSGNFGVAPQAIESREGTKELLNQLAGLQRHGSDLHSELSATASPSGSQPSTQTPEAETHQDSQVSFATQLPRSNVPVVRKPKPPGLTPRNNVGSTSIAKSSKFLASPTKGKHGNPLASTLGSVQAQAIAQRKSVNDNQALLGLLKNIKSAPRAPEVISESTTEQQTGRTTPSNGPAVIGRENEASRDITFAPSDDSISRAPIGTQKRKRQSPVNTSRKKAADVHETFAVEHGLDEARSGAAETEASISTLISQPASPLISESAILHHNAPLDPSVHSLSKLTSSVSGQDTGRNRISSRDVKIPKDQEILLNHADSWLPAQPGQREPSANIPISLLKILNQKADLRAQRPTKPRKQRNGTMTPSAVNDQTEDSESDVPVSSGQWPSSPERDQLPPDSSLESAEHSDHSVQRIRNNHNSVSSSRRQSRASFSSHSMQSGRPSPIPARPFSIASGSPRMVSPGLLSPSVVSTSAGEEVHRFTCQVPGCDKSYKNAGGLKYHVDHRHPRTGLFENIKCPVKDCAKSYASPGGLKYHIERHHDGNTTRSNNSGSATPATSGASLSMFLGLKSWSEREVRSGRTVADSGAEIESDREEVSASTLPSFDRGSRAPRDEEVFGRRSTTKSVLISDLPPDAQPASAQSATTNPDETHIAKESFSPIFLASPSPESDLEMTVPLALNEKADSIVSSAPMRRFPSTASQPQDPFTQVKRTPYVNGRVQNKSPSGSEGLSSPMKTSIYPLTNGTINDEVEFVSASIPSGPETSAAETHREIKSANAVEDQGIKKAAARLAEESNNQEVADNVQKKTDEVIAGVQQQMWKAEAAADKPNDSSHTMTENQSQNSESNQPSMTAKSNAKSQAIPETLLRPEDSHTEPLPQLPASDHADEIANEMKRKVADSSFVSPSLSKRQKRFMVPSAFNFTEKSEIPRDPSEGARQFRQDFLASRRSSESSTPTMSPTMSFPFITGTVSENPRDPSERARQTRQEFLASKRSSETSTPKMSPTIPFTALPGTIQPERQSSEVETNTGEVTVQTQLYNNEVEHEKMTELKDSSSRSQRTELDAAPISNGTASMKLGGDDAKPSLQNGPSSDLGADSLMIVTQNADVEGPHAEESPLIEARSNDEAQRAQSVELDVLFQSSHHQEAENDLANTKDDADQIVGPGIDLTFTSHDQLRNPGEDGRPKKPESDEARKDLPAGADKGAEQKSNASTNEIISNRISEPYTAALKPVHQQRSVQENADTQTSDNSASVPTPHPESFTVNADAQILDEIAPGPTSQQQLVRVDTDTPMADVQADQDITRLEHIPHMGEPMNQTTPFSFAVTASLAESNTENQPHVSSAATEPAVALSDPISNSEMTPAEEHRNVVHLPTETTEQKHPSVTPNLFDDFKATYPAYPGDMKHFAAICRKISQLVKDNRMEHQSLWDDFIVRHKIEYPGYLRRCAEEAEDAVPYEDFYQTEIEEPQYQKRVINRRNLEEALALVAQKPSVEKVQVEPVKDDVHRVESVDNKTNFGLDPAIENMHNEYAPANDDETLELAKVKSAPKPADPNEAFRKPSESQVTIGLGAERVHREAVRDDEPRVEPVTAKVAFKKATSTGIVHNAPELPVTIDLTGDDPPDERPKRTKESEIPPQSHLINSVSVQRPPLQYCRDNSGNLYQVPYTPPALLSSQPLSPQSMVSPLLPATASTKSIAQSNGRSLPWKGSDHSVFRISPNATASNSPKRIPASEMPEVQAKGFSNAHSQLSAKSTPNGSKQSQGSLNTYHRIIQSNWGLKAHELLEPKYYCGQALSETMIELLAEIASKVNVREARNRIKEVIDTRIRVSARRGSGHPSQDRKMLKSDLEVVRGIVKTSTKRRYAF